MQGLASGNPGFNHWAMATTHM